MVADLKPDETPTIVLTTPRKRAQKLRPLTVSKLIQEHSRDRRSHKETVRKSLEQDFPNPNTNRFRILGIALVVVAACQFGISNLSELASSFLPSEQIQFYEEQISTFINDNLDDTCLDSFKGNDFVKALHGNVLHQDASIATIQHIFRNHTNVSAIALVGGSGTGKTFTTQLLQTHFQWPNNIQHLIWTSGWQPVNLLDLIVHRLGKCGQNLIIIDSIPASSHLKIADFHREITDILTKRTLRAIVVYVFNIPTFLDAQLVELASTTQQVVTANDAARIQSIVFQPISRDGVRLCIQKYCELRGTVDECDTQMLHILDSIDADRSGCKHVHAQISLHV